MAQFTKKAIIEGFVELLNERPFDKISVVDIAERCEVNRNTFYYYYTDVYALVDELFRTETQKIIEQNLECDSWQEAFMQATDFAQRNRRAIYHLYNSINRDRVEAYLYDVTLLGMESYIRAEAEGLDVSADDVHLLAVFYSAALLGLVSKWLRDGMKQDADFYISNLGRLLDGNIRSSLERSADAKFPGDQCRPPKIQALSGFLSEK